MPFIFYISRNKIFEGLYGACDEAPPLDIGYPLFPERCAKILNPATVSSLEYYVLKRPESQHGKGPWSNVI